MWGDQNNQWGAPPAQNQQQQPPPPPPAGGFGQPPPQDAQQPVWGQPPPPPPAGGQQQQYAPPTNQYAPPPPMQAGPPPPGPPPPGPPPPPQQQGQGQSPPPPQGQGYGYPQPNQQQAAQPPGPPPPGPPGPPGPGGQGQYGPGPGQFAPPPAWQPGQPPVQNQAAGYPRQPQAYPQPPPPPPPAGQPSAFTETYNPEQYMPQQGQSPNYADQQQQMMQPSPQYAAQPGQPTQAEEAPQYVAVTLQRGMGSVGRIQNHETFPRNSVEDREQQRQRVAAMSPKHVKGPSGLSVRCSTPVLPSTPQLADKLALPMGIVVQPLADDNVPLVNFSQFGDVGVIRCRRCRTYVNPYVPFTDGGRRWQCNVCRNFNDVPSTYFCATDPATGLRKDIESRPELCNATCEFVAPAEYMVRPPQRPTFLFVLDVSYNAVNSGMLAQQCSGIREALATMKDDEHTQIGFVAYDSVVYLFSLRSTLTAAKMIVVPDVVNDEVKVNEQSLLDPVELPAVPEDLIVPVQDSFSIIDSLLERLPAMFASTKNVGCAFGPAVTTGITLLTPTGGKMVASLCSMPLTGDGKVANREDKKLFNQPKEVQNCLPGADWYKTRALACSQAQISVDLVVVASTNVELATVVPIARHTSGHVYTYNLFTKTTLHQDMVRLLTRNTGYESVLRIRCTNGVHVSNFHGHFHVRGQDLLTLPALDNDTSYGLQLSIVTPSINAQAISVQLAILYTTKDRERRIRVHTLMLEVSSNLARIHNSIDPGAMAAFMGKCTIEKALTSSFQLASANMTEKMVQSLRHFRNLIPGVGQYSGQLLLPRAWSTVPMMYNGFQRLAASRFITTVETPADKRVGSQSRWMMAPLDTLITEMTTWIFTVYDPRYQPDTLPCLEISSAEVLKSDGIYLIDSGTALVLWVGRSADPQVVQTLGLQGPDGKAAFLPELVGRYDALVAKQQAYNIGGGATPLLIVGQGDPTVDKMIPLWMTDDELKEGQAYGNYLSSLHKKVVMH